MLVLFFLKKKKSSSQSSPPWDSPKTWFLERREIFWQMALSSVLTWFVVPNSIHILGCAGIIEIKVVSLSPRLQGWTDQLWEWGRQWQADHYVLGTKSLWKRSELGAEGSGMEHPCQFSKCLQEHWRDKFLLWKAAREKGWGAAKGNPSVWTLSSLHHSTAQACLNALLRSDSVCEETCDVF